MTRFLSKRLIGSIIVLLVVSLMSYSLIYLAPGDPVAIALARRIGRLPTAEQVATLSAEYGFDKPIPVQFFNWVIQAVQGDLGRSMRTGGLVLDEVALRFKYTVFLASLTMLVAVVVGIPSGFLAAWRKNHFLDHATRVVVLLSVAIPDFWLGFLLILVFSITLRWLPSHGVESAKSLIMPVLCLAVANTARLNRLTRSSMLEVERENYLLTARAKGLSRRAAWVKHGFPNIAVPVVTLFTTLFSGTVAATIIMEQVFAWPGIGAYFLQAVNYRDIAVIQALVVIYGAVFVFFNLLADIVYVAIDPRIRLE